jgi:hypothetical protein
MLRGRNVTDNFLNAPAALNRFVLGLGRWWPATTDKADEKSECRFA